MFDRSIPDFDKEWSIYSEDIMREYDFINDEDMNDEYLANDSSEDHNEGQQRSENDDQSEENQTFQEEKINSYSDEEQITNDETQSAEEQGSTCSDEEYCPYCDGLQNSEDNTSSVSEEPYINNHESANEQDFMHNNVEQKLHIDRRSPLLIEQQQPITYGEDLQIKAFRVNPIPSCAHQQQFPDEHIDTELRSIDVQDSQIFLKSTPYRDNNGTLFYRCTCGCSLVFDEHANLFFDMSNKSASDVPDCKFHCPCGCDMMFAASDILLNEIYYSFYQRMVRKQFLNEHTNNPATTYNECKQYFSNSNENNIPLPELRVDGDYDADDEN